MEHVEIYGTYTIRAHEFIEHIDATIASIRRCKLLERIGTELACQVNQCKHYWKSLLLATFGFCHKIYY